MPYRPSASDIHFSLEIFPPKSGKGEAQLERTLETFYKLKPDFISVTCYSQNTASDFTRKTSKRVLAGYGKVAAHVTCVNKDRETIERLARDYWDCGIRRVLALRGDPVAAAGGAGAAAAGGFRYAAQLVACLKRISDFDITVAAYPEVHPQARSAEDDLIRLQEKVDAGADHVITQFFFDPEVFLRFRDKVTGAGITVPLIPGLLPILNFERVIAFSRRCNANVPGFLPRMFDGIEPGSRDHQLLAMNVLSHQITRLIDEGVTTFHFYTLNEVSLTSHICHWLRTAF